MRFRNWIGTSFKDSIDISTCEWYAFQTEQCPSTGRPHIQLVVGFHNAITLKSAKERLGDPACHLEPCRDKKKAIEYCTKSDTRIGEPQIHNIECDDPAFWQHKTEAELWEAHPTWMLRHYCAYRAWQKQTKITQTIRPKPTVVYIWGPPGTGKSFKARDCEEFYIKPSGPWWDGYWGQRRVIFDDFYSTETYGDMLRWLSEAPINVPIKGSMIPLTSTEFYITTNSSFEDIYPNIQDKSALRRRITTIIHMDTIFPNDTT